ncbi:MAG TPA: YfhO family protein [Candidatus Binatia bacterium]|nr:YfhO family protein [Candidatus Binatia bacterium]
MDKKHADYVSVLALILSVLWFCQDLAVNGEVPFYRDLTNYFYPLRYSLYESYRAGELPLWDRHFAQGFPNLAGFQSGAFYPPHFVFFFLPFFAAIRVLFVFHFFLAAIGTYALLRRWSYSWDLSIVGSLLFTFGGVIVSLSNLLNHFQTAVWLPWLILTWEQLLLTPKWRNFIAVTFIASLQILAGSPELFAMSMGLALFDGFRIRDSEPRVSCFRVFGFALACNLLMVAVIMAQILPTAELVMGSRRSQSIPAAEAFMWSFKPSSLINLFFLDKEVELNISTGLRLFFTRDVSLLITNYFGIISIFGIALWTYYATRRERILLTALALGSLAIALGGNALVYPYLFKHFPFLSAVRFPEKFFFLTYSLVIFMTIGGLRSLLLDETKQLRGPVIILASICVAWLGLYLSLRFHSGIVSDFIAENSSIPPLSDIHARATVSVLTNLQRQVILSLALFFLLVLVKVDKIRPLLFSVLLLSVVYVDLAWAHRSFLFTVKPDRALGSAPVIQPAEAKLTRFFYYPSPHDLHPAFYSVMGRPTFEQAVALSFENYLPNVGVFHGVDYFQEIDALNRRQYSDFLSFANNLDFERQIKLLSTFNVGYLVSFRELPENGVRLMGRFPKYFSWLYRVDRAVPRAYVVGKAIVEKESVKALQRLSTAEFEPLREVILDGDAPIRPSSHLKAQAIIERYENNVVTIQTAASEDGILVLADSYYPGWKVFVDGKETKIFKANHFFRAVVSPKGNHRIEFRYEPWSFRLGIIISTFTLVCVVAISLVLFLRQRKFAARSLVIPTRILQDQ